MPYNPDYPRTRKQYLEMLKETMIERDMVITEACILLKRWQKSKWSDFIDNSGEGLMNDTKRFLEGK